MTDPDEAGVEPGGSGHDHADEIGRKSRRALTWSLLGNFFLKIGSFAVTLTMARLLSPEDFGVYGVALAAMAVAMQVNDAGIIAACVQWRGRFEDITPTAATLALVSSVLVYALLWTAAPAFAALAGTPEATPVVRLLTLAVVVDGIAAVRSAALVRRFEQDRLTKANVAGVVVNAAVALPLGFSGAGAYSLAAAQLAGWIVTSALVFRMADLPIRLGFDKQVAKQLFIFGLPLAASFGVEAVLLNADFVIIGNVLGAVWLGYYLVAYNISNWVPGLVGTAVRYVSIPGFSRLAEQSTELVIEGVRRTVPLLVSAILPVAVIVTITAPQLIGFLYGEKWGPAASALTFLTVLMVIRMLTSLVVDILTSLGATKATVWLNVGWAAALLPALWIGTRLDGIRGTAIAHGIVAVCVALPLALLALRRSGITLGPTLRALVRPFLAAALSAVTCLLVDHYVGGPLLLQLVAAGGAAMTVYLLVVVPRNEFQRLTSRLVRTRSEPEVAE